jgi:hypothetical protein
VLFNDAEEGVHIELLGDDDTGTGEQRHQDADHNAVDVEQRKDQQTPICWSDVERLAPHLGHGIEVGVIEHHTLRYTGGATGEDQQRQRRRIHQWWPIPTRPLRVEIPDGQRRNPCLSAVPVFDHQQPRAGGLKLQRDLGVGQARIDRCDSGAQPPQCEQQHDELNPVTQLERHHISGADTELVKVTTCCSNTLQQPSIGQGPSPVRHGRAIGVEIRSSVGQRSKVHGECAYSGAGIANMMGKRPQRVDWSDIKRALRPAAVGG